MKYMMKKSKILAIALVISGLVIPLFGCSSSSSQATTQGNQTATVQRGNLSVDISAAGNLALSRTQDLAFEIAGYVNAVLVTAGDSVKEGQVLATLDTSAWEDQISTLEDQLTSAQRQLTTKQRAVTTAQQTLATKKNAVPTAERGLLQAQVSVKNAEIALEQAEGTYKWPDIEVAQANVDVAKAHLQYALDSRDAASGDTTAVWDRAVAKAQAELNTAQTTLNALISDVDPDQVVIKKMQLTIAQGQLTDSQQAINDANTAVVNAQVALDDANTAVGDAQRSVAEAQKKLDDASKKSPKIVAPFDGFVTTVNVKGGDEIYVGTVALQIADPNKFQAVILVSEMDILNIKLGGQASVQVTAAQGVSLSANVTQIAPTATIQSGVVNYQVTVEVQPVPTQSQTRGNATTDNTTTQRQSSGTFSPRQGGASSGQTAGSTTQDFQLRQGLTATVSIIIAQSNNVLLIPNAAIKTQGRQIYVQVLTPTGTTEDRTIQTGISNYQYTEVSGGLSEGEQVVVPKGTATTTTSSQGQRPGGFIPGVGGILR